MRRGVMISFCSCNMENRDERDCVRLAFFSFPEDTIFSPSYLQRVASERNSKRLQICSSTSIDVSCPASPQHSPTHQPCKITVLIIVVHAGSVLGERRVSLFTSREENIICMSSNPAIYPRLIALEPLLLVSMIDHSNSINYLEF